MDATTDLQQPLLEKYRIIYLPEEITHDTYQKISSALLVGRSMHPHKRLKLWCHGWGGEIQSALAIVDIIRFDGRVDGILIGSAFSAHAFVWAACSRRFVYANASLGIHQSFNFNPVSVDESGHTITAKGLSEVNATVAHIFAEASDRSEEWWLKKIRKVRSVDIFNIPAKRLVKLGMARWIKKS